MSVYVVTGSDEGRVVEEAAALFEELKPPGSDEFANEIIEGVADNAEDAFQKAASANEALQTIGFFGGDKVVWLKGANFLGNDTGPMNPALLHNVSALGLAGLGWQMEDHLPTDPAGVINPQQIGKLEQRQSVASAALKRLHPGVRVLSSADIACTAAFWRVSQAAMANASLAAQLFLHWPNGTLFLDSWGDTPAPWWNFSDPAAVEFWIQEGPIATAMHDTYWQWIQDPAYRIEIEYDTEPSA